MLCICQFLDRHRSREYHQHSGSNLLVCVRGPGLGGGRVQSVVRRSQI